ncbi:hypothetical protein [Enterobacter cloacae]
MANLLKNNGICILLVLMSLNCYADERWNAKEVNMQCGSAIVMVRAECKTDPENADSSMCKGVTIKISQVDKIFTAKLPYMPIEQRKKLENQKFTFDDVIDTTDWAPQEMYCIDDKYILVGYWDGMNDAETIDGSLSFNVTAPIFDFDGHFVNEKNLKS